MRSALLLGLALIGLVTSPALADEQFVPLAESGDWVAMEHRPSMLDPPDVCLAANTKATVLLRDDGTTLEIRSTNQSWSLPNGVKGNLAIAVNNNSYSFDIDYNTDSMVSATVDPNKVSLLLDDMAKAASLKLTIGKDAPISVSLDGSTKALNAFRTCAGIGGGGSGGGSNPFQ
jgi:hypothetical protein